MNSYLDGHEFSDEASLDIKMRVQSEDSDSSIAVIIVNYGSSELLKELSFDANFELVIVDNFISVQERTRISLLAEQRGWRLVLSNANLGFGQGANLGVRKALELGAKYLLLLNPDASISSDHVRLLRDRLVEDGRRMVSPVIFSDSGLPWFRGAQLRKMRGVAHHVPLPGAGSRNDWLTAACLMLTTEAWLQLEGFDPDFFLYWEDVDFTYRWKCRGGELLVVPDARAIHGVGGTQTASPMAKSSLWVEYNIRGRYTFSKHHNSWFRHFVWMALTPLYVKRLAMIADVRRHPRVLVEFVRAAVRGTLGGRAESR